MHRSTAPIVNACIKKIGSWSFASSAFVSRWLFIFFALVLFIAVVTVTYWIPSGHNISHIEWLNTQLSLAPTKEAHACDRCIYSANKEASYLRRPSCRCHNHR